MSYWDTSCLVKLYAPEADSAKFQSYIANDTIVVTSVIARLELWATLSRKEAVGDLQSDGAGRALVAFDADVVEGLVVIEPMSQLVVARFMSTIEECYQRNPPLPLRTLDAIHLSTATASGQSKIVATDKRFREAAKLLGFSVFPN